MGARRSWWQKILKSLAVIAASVLVIVLILVVVRFYGTGFNGYTIINTSKTTGGVVSPTTTTTTAYQPGKTLWDWLQLLIIPAVLAVGGYLFNYSTSKTEREVATDSQRQEALQIFIDKISDLLLHENLRDDNYNGEAPTIIRARLLAILPELDGKRKGDIIQFMYDADLVSRTNLYGIDLNDAIMPYARMPSAFLDGAKFHKAYLFGANFVGANLYANDLSGADLRKADLRESCLAHADLSGANLSGADLKDAIGVTEEQLKTAKSLKGATMPDGSIHP